MTDPLTGAPIVTPAGEFAVDHRQMVEARNNVIHARGMPVFFWPTIRDRPGKAVVHHRPRAARQRRRLRHAGDGRLRRVPALRHAQSAAGNRLHLSTDYLSDRGPAAAPTSTTIGRRSSASSDPRTASSTSGRSATTALDNLGLGRRDIVPEEDFRFRLLGEHRQRLENGWEVTAEAGWLSDRTFQEQYYEAGLGPTPRPAHRRAAQAARSTIARCRWRPTGRSTTSSPKRSGCRGSTTTGWASRCSTIGSRGSSIRRPRTPIRTSRRSPRIRRCRASSVYLPWEVDPLGNPISPTANGSSRGRKSTCRCRLGARQGRAVRPRRARAVGRSARRRLARAGLRAHRRAGERAVVGRRIPNVRDPLFNLNGLAHKVVFDAEFSYADANAELRRAAAVRSSSTTFRSSRCRRRLFKRRAAADDHRAPSSIRASTHSARACRTGSRRPSTEIADDLMALRMGVRHRWQTKRGAAGNQHIVDWLTLDMNATYFPDPEPR